MAHWLVKWGLKPPLSESPSVTTGERQAQLCMGRDFQRSLKGRADLIFFFPHHRTLKNIIVLFQTYFKKLPGKLEKPNCSH